MHFFLVLVCLPLSMIPITLARQKTLTSDSGGGQLPQLMNFNSHVNSVDVAHKGFIFVFCLELDPCVMNGWRSEWMIERWYSKGSIRKKIDERSKSNANAQTGDALRLRSCVCVLVFYWFAQQGWCCYFVVLLFETLLLSWCCWAFFADTKRKILDLSPNEII